MIKYFVSFRYEKKGFLDADQGFGNGIFAVGHHIVSGDDILEITKIICDKFNYDAVVILNFIKL